MGNRRFVVLDRDGTIIRDCHYLSRPEQVELMPNSIAALRRLRELGLGVVVVTNQSGIGRGILRDDGVRDVHAHLEDLLTAEGVPVAGIYYCPHVPEDGCSCRKPAVDLVTRAAREHGFDPARAFVVGDRPCDVELGNRVGATSLLVRTGKGERFAKDPRVKADFVVADLLEAAAVIEAALR